MVEVVVGFGTEVGKRATGSPEFRSLVSPPGGSPRETHAGITDTGEMLEHIHVHYSSLLRGVFVLI